jgi:hypothetical protein
MALEPCLVQCIPARLSRVPMATLHPASTTPVEVHLCLELRIAHTFAVGPEIMETATSRIGASDLASDGGE